MNKPAKITQPSTQPAYADDAYGWAMAQSALIRARQIDEIDWKNVAEEIESVGRSERSAYHSQLTRVLLHMLKWDAQPERRSMSWWLSIINGRDDALRVLRENPSLKPERKKIHESALASARRQAWAETGISQSVFELMDISQADAFDREIPRPEGDD